ncbi:MAG: hypothetical protein ACNS62_03845 [Candidatus Cyclobacteriaceae bacterium M3_2C_046]
MKKILAFIFALSMIAVSGCTYRTCPTYTQERDQDQTEMVKLPSNGSEREI